MSKNEERPFKSLNKISTSTSQLEYSLLLQKVYLVSFYESIKQDEKLIKFRKKIDEEQIDVYIKWINLQFSRLLYDESGTKISDESKTLYPNLKVNNLSVDLADGIRFIFLIEIIYKTKLKKEYGDKKLGCLKLHKIRNFMTCLHYLNNQVKIKCTGINPIDLADGNVKMLIGLLFLIKHDYEIKTYKPRSLIELKQAQQNELPLDEHINDKKTKNSIYQSNSSEILKSQNSLSSFVIDVLLSKDQDEKPKLDKTFDAISKIDSVKQAECNTKFDQLYNSHVKNSNNDGKLDDLKLLNENRDQSKSNKEQPENRYWVGNLFNRFFYNNKSPENTTETVSDKIDKLNYPVLNEIVLESTCELNTLEIEKNSNHLDHEDINLFYPQINEIKHEYLNEINNNLNEMNEEKANLNNSNLENQSFASNCKNIEVDLEKKLPNIIDLKLISQSKSEQKNLFEPCLIKNEAKTNQKQFIPYSIGLDNKMQSDNEINEDYLRIDTKKNLVLETCLKEEHNKLNEISNQTIDKINKPLEAIKRNNKINNNFENKKMDSFATTFKSNDEKLSNITQKENKIKQLKFNGGISKNENKLSDESKERNSIVNGIKKNQNNSILSVNDLNRINNENDKKDKFNCNSVVNGKNNKSIPNESINDRARSQTISSITSNESTNSNSSSFSINNSDTLVKSTKSLASDSSSISTLDAENKKKLRKKKSKKNTKKEKEIPSNFNCESIPIKKKFLDDSIGDDKNLAKQNEKETKIEACKNKSNNEYDDATLAENRNVKQRSKGLEAQSKNSSSSKPNSTTNENIYLNNNNNNNSNSNSSHNSNKSNSKSLNEQNKTDKKFQSSQTRFKIAIITIIFFLIAIFFIFVFSNNNKLSDLSALISRHISIS